MKVARITRRVFLEGGLGLTIANFMPWSGIPRAFAAAEDDRIAAAAKGLGGGAELRGMIWSNYYAALQKPMEEFKSLTGIGVGSIQDISIFDAPQRAMAEALSHSPQFDFFHIDSNMIPSLASAGLLEPLDEYMKKAQFKIEAVGDYASFMTYKGHTYGVPTDGNVHIQYLRKDLMEDPDSQKRFADKYGKKLEYPQTWDDEFQIQEFFHNPEKDLYGSGSLRNRANGPTWWYMMFYSAGGFPFDNDMNPTIDNEAGQYAVDVYLREKKVAHPESSGWGTPQMIPRIFGGKVVSCQYWDGTIGQNEKDGSPTKGKWTYGLVPGSDKSGKRIYRSISSPLAAILVNKYSPRKAQAAYLALWWGTLKNSTPIVSDQVVSFHDPWHKGHMTAPSVVAKYTDQGMKAINANLQVVSPPIYLTGYLEFQDALGKNLSEAYVGQLAAKDVLKRTTEDWNRIVNRIGKRKLREELASYKAVMPKIDKPA
ncbi:MAG TPA: extracellular solute-binding protein [Xanthobacteraceae bacterium]|nr:extracellular solute-binding protein [Xanthobacteraceae bacterium]